MVADSVQPVHQRYAIQHWSQNEQEGGFWLLSLTLEANRTGLKQDSKNSPPPPSEFDLGCQFCIEDSSITLCLFQQTIQNASIILQFLSQQSVTHTPQYLSIHPPMLENQSMIKTCQTAKNVMLLGSDLMMANLFYLAKIRNTNTKSKQTLALLHSENGFPFRAKPALLMAPYLPPEAIGTSSLLEDWHIPNRLANQNDLPGCFDGSLEELFAYWLTEQHNDCHESWQVIICASNETQKKCLNVSQPYDWVHCLGIHYDA